MSVSVTSFYRFQALEDEKVKLLKSNLEQIAADSDLRGLCLLGREGINATLSGARAGLEQIKALVNGSFNEAAIEYKDSESARHPFHFFRIKVKDEIVTIGKPGFAPSTVKNYHLTPEQWHEAMKDPEVVVLDTRNDYEVDIGKFRSAVDFRTKEFREFPEAVRQSGIPRDKKILMYCTGGIRCEKAILEMHEQGYENVYQLDGGILNYLEKLPNKDFDGECFVFDYRVAVDQELQPTQKYKLCPHCGQPAHKPVVCVKCGTETVICDNCVDESLQTCSKNCAHHAKHGHKSSSRHEQELNKRHKI
jgi:UPF0176 protein